MFIAFMNLTRDLVVACPLENNRNKTLASLFYIILLHILLKLVIHSFVFADCLDNPCLGLVESVVVHPMVCMRFRKPLTNVDIFPYCCRVLCMFMQTSTSSSLLSTNLFLGMHVNGKK